jgi:hypothetical protein
MRYSLILPCAEDKTDRRILVREHPVLPRVIQVQVHLPGVRELAKFQIDDDEAAQPSMEEDQVDAIPLVPDPQATLAAHESEVAAELQQKTFELFDEHLFQLALRVLVLDTQEQGSGSLISSSAVTSSPGRDTAPS